MALLRGVLTAFDSANYKATVRLDGSAPQTVNNIKTSRAIPAAEMVAARRLIVDTGEAASADEWVVTAIF